jgi:hypothetical protein
LPSGVVLDRDVANARDIQKKPIAHSEALHLQLRDCGDVAMGGELGSDVLLLLDIGCLSFHR